MSKIEVFLSYSNKDKKLAEEVINALEPLKMQNVILISHKSYFLPGTDWASDIKRYINQADIILLLLSSDFLASKYHKREIEQALSKQEEGKTRVIPIILRPVSGWRGTELGMLQALPSNGRAISAWSDIDLACFDVAQGVRKIVEELNTDTEAPLSSSTSILHGGNPRQSKLNTDTEAPLSSPLENKEIIGKKSDLDNLEQELRRSYAFMRDYQNKFRLAYNQSEKLEAQRAFEKRLEKTRRTMSEYKSLAREVGISVPEDIIQDFARFEDFSNTENVT